MKLAKRNELPTLLCFDKHLPALDGMRGMSISLVLMFTTYIVFCPELSTAAIRAYVMICKVGWCGVDMFFVLSGFLITGILLDTRTRPGFFRNFYMRRMLRIFPLYYGLLLIGFVILRPVLAGFEKYDYIANHQYWFWLHLQNIWIALLGHWPDTGSLDHFWSLAVEAQFYLLWPFIVYRIHPYNIQRLCLLIIVMALASRCVALAMGTSPSTIYVLTVTRMDALAMGGLIASTVRVRHGIQLINRFAPVIAISGAIALIMVFILRLGLNTYDPVIQSVGYTLITVFFGALLGVTITKPKNHALVRIFCWKPLRYLGIISYGVYIFHVPIMKGLEHAWNLDQLPTFQKHILFLIVSLTITICLASLSWKFYEKPFLNLKRFFPKKV